MLLTGSGGGNGKAWGCDLSYKYVEINAEYTTWELYLPWRKKLSSWNDEWVQLPSGECSFLLQWQPCLKKMLRMYYFPWDQSDKCFLSVIMWWITVGTVTTLTPPCSVLNFWWRESIGLTNKFLKLVYKAYCWSCVSNWSPTFICQLDWNGVNFTIEIPKSIGSPVCNFVNWIPWWFSSCSSLVVTF